MHAGACGGQREAQYDVPMTLKSGNRFRWGMVHCLQRVTTCPEGSGTTAKKQLTQNCFFTIKDINSYQARVNPRASQDHPGNRP
jgi:hypothetical protein